MERIVSVDRNSGLVPLCPRTGLIRFNEPCEILMGYVPTTEQSGMTRGKNFDMDVHEGSPGKRYEKRELMQLSITI